MDRDHFGAVVQKGIVTFDDPLRWRAVVARHEGRHIAITLQRQRPVRSLAQNRYYWSVVVPIFGEWTGEEKDEAHETLKTLHLMVEKVLPTGELVRKAGSSRTLNTVEFSAYVERVCIWLALHGVYVPPPGQMMEASL